MRQPCRHAVKVLAAALAYLIAAQPAFAAVQAVRAPAGSVSAAPVSAAGAALQVSHLLPGSLSLSGLPLQPLSSLPRISAPAVAPSAGLAAPLSPQAGVQAQALAAPLAPAAVSVSGGVKAPAPQSTPALTEQKVGSAAQAAAEAVAGLESLPADSSKGAAERQFSVLTGERRAPGSAAVAEPAAQAPGLGSFAHSSLSAAAQEQGTVKAEVPPAKAGFTQVFHDPERNKTFWRYVLGYATFLFGFRMYVVGLPYYISGLTKNSLAEASDPRLAAPEVVTALVRENRSLARIAHWVAQAFSYATAPLFSRNSEAGPKKWLVRSYLIRAGVLAAIPGLFFASGLFSLQAAFIVFFGLVAAQSFFQGISCTTEGAATAQILGDKSVTQAERTKANSILTFVAAAMSIVGPVLAGQAASLGSLFGKASPGGAVIYGVYALVSGIAGLIFATLGLRGAKATGGAAAAAPAGPAEKLSVRGVLGNLWSSFKDGLGLILHSRLLRTMLALSLLSALFADPLIFNVLPEFVGSVVAAHPGTLGALLQVPVLGWFLKALTGTPMGYFALMTAGASVGSMVASVTINPLRRLFIKLGFKTEESLTIPFYVMAALEAPLFWLMIAAPSMWAVLGLYLLQSLLTGFAGITISSFYQKTLGGYDGKDVNKVLAAQSLMNIIAAIIATYVYGFLLTGIPIATALLIAAGATTVVGAIRLAAPWLFFSKEQRGPKSTPAKLV